MAHIALYRTWRPQAFNEVVGQKHIIQTLQNALREGRFSHAYLFSGPRGTGKTSAAKILAKAVNCENGPGIEPCNECSACRRMTEGTVLDVVEIDAASNRGVEEIRDIRDKVRFAPTEVRRKVYIIDEVHMLTTEAFNALLKTLEEPPAHVMFILATTEPHRLPATIVSRCQRFDFRRVSLQDQVERLRYVCEQENVQAQPEALEYISRLSDGGMRDAISLLDQIASYANNTVTLADVLAITGGVAADQFEKLAQAIREKDISTSLEVISQWMEDGKSADKSLENLILYFRDLLLIKLVPNSEAMTERIMDAAHFQTVASAFSPEEMIRVIETLNSYQAEMKYSAQPQTLFEVAVMKICSFTGSVAVAAEAAPRSAQEEPAHHMRQLANKIEQLEQRVSQLADQLAAADRAKPIGAAPIAAKAPPAKLATSLRTTGMKLDSFLDNKNNEPFKVTMQKWNLVLNRVKEQKITVHAWLIDGEPVAFHENTVLLAFKSSMHRETTDKPANKQLIEQELSEVLGQQTRVATVMLKEWNEAQSEAVKAQPEILQLEAEGPPSHEIKEEWIREAIERFGEDLVTVKEE